MTSEPSASRNRLVLVVYTAAIFVSALLLFSVQPLFTKMVLPRLGGSPAVWSVAMVFFQSLLLAGYAYAHLLMKLKRRVVPIAVHLVLLVVALLTLPLSIRSGWGEPPTSGYAVWLLGLFAVSIGLPFFALAANNPLLQAWFVRTGHPSGPDPYFLYASSNIGSFLALLSYPVLLEPMFTLRTQNLIWTGGYGLLILLIAGCGVLLLRSPANAGVLNMQVDDADAPAPSWGLRARWIFLAAVPSGLLIAVTAHISTDVAAAPLLWVLPLSLYLLTWVLVFQSRPLLPHKWMLLAQPLAIAGVVILLAVAVIVLIVKDTGWSNLMSLPATAPYDDEKANWASGLEVLISVNLSWWAYTAAIARNGARARSSLWPVVFALGLGVGLGSLAGFYGGLVVPDSAGDPTLFVVDLGGTAFGIVALGFGGALLAAMPSAAIHGVTSAAAARRSWPIINSASGRATSDRPTAAGRPIRIRVEPCSMAV